MVYKWFLYSDWDQTNDFGMQLYNVELREQIGYLAAGSTFDSAYIDFALGVLEFYDDANAKILHSFKLKLAIDEE